MRCESPLHVFDICLYFGLLFLRRKFKQRQNDNWCCRGSSGVTDACICKNAAEALVARHNWLILPFHPINGGGRDSVYWLQPRCSFSGMKFHSLPWRKETFNPFSSGLYGHLCTFAAAQVENDQLIAIACEVCQRLHCVYVAHSITHTISIAVTASLPRAHAL